MSDDAVKLKIIFDGKEAQNHALPLGDLGKSLQGIASVIAVSGTFVLSHEIPLRPSEYKVQVYTKAEFKAGSIEIILYIKTIADYLKEFGEVAAGILALMGLLKMIFGKRDKNLDNYALADLLKEDHNIFRQTIDKLLIINQKYVEQAIRRIPLTSIRSGHLTSI